jgi:hypothetical protein
MAEPDDDTLAFWRQRMQSPKDLPPEIGLLDAEPRDLERWGLPQQPNAETEPALLEVWQQMFGAPLTFQFAQLQAIGTPSPTQSFIGSRVESSRNWSGALMLPRRAARFSTLASSWTVPPVFSVPAVAGAIDPACSIWVGSGGHRRWSRALPQAGTAHFLAPQTNTQRHVAWVQWWVRGLPQSGPLSLPWPQVRPADRFFVWLVRHSPVVWWFVLVNRTLAQGVALGLNMAGVPDAAAEGVSAEYIVERPRDPATKIVHPLVNFGDVPFSACVASAGGRQRELAGGRLIRMVDRVPVRNRTCFIAVPGRRGLPRGRLKIEYRGP